MPGYQAEPDVVAELGHDEDGQQIAEHERSTGRQEAEHADSVDGVGAAGVGDEAEQQGHAQAIAAMGTNQSSPIRTTFRAAISSTGRVTGGSRAARSSRTIGTSCGPVICTGSSAGR